MFKGKLIYKKQSSSDMTSEIWIHIENNGEK